MKHMRHFCVASILTFAITFSAFAGDIHCGVISEPPPQESMSADELATGITTPNETSSLEVISVDPMADFTLNILQSVLALF